MSQLETQTATQDRIDTFLATPSSLRLQRGIAAIREGKGVLLVDDEDRENEGDIIFAAQTLTDAQMAQLIRDCSGIVCLCLTQEQADALELTPMVENNGSRYSTPFTVTIEAKEGVTTGVSAKDRTTTIKTAIAPNAKPSDLVHPGHVFPLRARENGVLDRRGHTEGSVDLTHLAGLQAGAVLCELTNPDGTMAKLPEILTYGDAHNMPVLTIEDIAQYRRAQGTQIA